VRAATEIIIPIPRRWNGAWPWQLLATSISVDARVPEETLRPYNLDSPMLTSDDLSVGDSRDLDGRRSRRRTDPRSTLRIWLPSAHGAFLVGFAVSAMLFYRDRPFRFEDAVISDLLAHSEGSPATRLVSLRSLAEPEALPPAPMRARISYGPRHVSGLSDMPELTGI
jgi:hypothetical protein